MHDLDALGRFLDRYGLPLVLLIGLGGLAYALIRGPGMVLATKTGEAIQRLANAAVDYLTSSTEAIKRTGLELVEVRAATAREAEATRSAIAREAEATRAAGARDASAVREHVSEEVRSLRDRVSTAENEIARHVNSVR